MKKQLHIIFKLFIVVIFLASGCKKEGVPPQSKPENNLDIAVKVIDGTLVFKDDSTFVNYWSSILKNDPLSSAHLNNLKLQSGFISMADIYRTFHEEINKSETKDDYLKILQNYNDIIKLNSDSTISLKYDLYSFSEILNRKGQFVVGNKTKDWSEISKNQNKKKTDKVSLAQGDLPYGSLGSKTIEYVSSFFANKLFLKLELFHDVYDPGLPFLPVHSVYYKMEEYHKNFWGTKKSRISSLYIKDAQWNYIRYQGGNDFSQYFSGFNPLFESQDVTGAQFYLLSNVPALQIRDFSAGGYSFYSTNVPYYPGVIGFSF